MKNFLAIFIYAAFFNNPDHFRKLFRTLLFIALLLGTIALIQFIWAMGSVYIYGKDMSDPGIYIFSSKFIHNTMALDNLTWRSGIFRTPSLTYHPYILGLYCLLILTIYSYQTNKANKSIIILLLAGIFGSVSRIAYGGLIFLLTMQLLRGKKLAILFLVISLFVFIPLINIDSDANISTYFNLFKSGQNENCADSKIRVYTRCKSIEIWKDHPYWGVGPGMFGGIVASKYRSHVYEEYNVSNQSYLKSAGGIEQFWFQVLAETGVVGTLCFINLIIYLIITLFKLRASSISQEIIDLFSGLMAFTGCILIYSIGSGINIAPVLFTYCAFVGVGAGSLYNQSEGRSKG